MYWAEKKENLLLPNIWKFQGNENIHVELIMGIINNNKNNIV